MKEKLKTLTGKELEDLAQDYKTTLVRLNEEIEAEENFEAIEKLEKVHQECLDYLLQIVNEAQRREK